MLYFFQSNRQERLFDRLCTLHSETPGDPLRPREIVVQNPGMARWLSQQIALRQGIAANIHFPLPARFIWQIFAGQLDLEENGDLFTRSVLRWRIFVEMNRPEASSAFAEIRGYLADDSDGRKAFQLAGKIGDLFDQYLVYRPDMLLAWESDPANTDWQAVLWRRLTTSSGEHRAGYFDRFMQKARQNGLDPAALPQQVAVFGISSLAPSYLAVIQAISRIVDVHLFHLSPCREFWADLASEAEIAKKSFSHPEAAAAVSTYFDTGNPLLASWGKLGREFLGLMYNLDMTEESEYEEPPGPSLLACLQRDILDLVDHSGPAGEKLTLAEKDRSVQLHSCYSRMREVQVLHDRLLEMFEQDPALLPGDVLVMAPDIEQYAPYVRAVFGGMADQMFIPWSLADRSVAGEHPLTDSLLGLFELTAGRCSAPEIMAFLEDEMVMRRFQLQRNDLTTVRNWIRESGIRWGLDLAHRHVFSREVDDAHTWNFGLNRLFMGFFTGSGPELVHGIAPLGSISTAGGELLGRMAEFLDRLRWCREKLNRDRRPADWTTLLLDILDQFYDAGTGEEDQQVIGQLREAICSLEEDWEQAGFTGKVSLAVIKSWLQEIGSTPSSGQAFLSGRVTFCNMVPMRSVPFNIVCLLGMNDSDYPRDQGRIGFDRMAQKPRPGDRNRRDDDRYLFLEALLSARSVFYISWIGHDQHDNSPRPPSVIVADLLDYIERSFVTGSGNPLPQPIICHPLQPFSSKCFDGTPGTGSFASQWLPHTVQKRDNTVFIPGSLPAPPPEWQTVELRQFLQFWSHPVLYFLQERLEMKLSGIEELLEEDEPFVPDPLHNYLLISRLVDLRLDGQEPERIYSRLLAEGALPHGMFARNIFSRLNRQADEFLSALTRLIREPVEPLEVNINIDSYRLQGWLDGLYQAGCIRYRPARLKGRDLVKTWIEHLVLNFLGTAGSKPRSIFLGGDKIVQFTAVAESVDILKTLLDLYWEGLSRPLHFYPETSRCWFEAKDGKKDAAAESRWLGNYMARGEGDGPEYRLALQGKAPLDDEFVRLAGAVYGPLFAHLEEVDAAL